MSPSRGDGRAHAPQDAPSVWSRAADGGAAGPLWLLLATLDAVHLHVVLALLAVAYLSWKVRLAHHSAAVSVACPCTRASLPRAARVRGVTLIPRLLPLRRLSHATEDEPCGQQAPPHSPRACCLVPWAAAVSPQSGPPLTRHHLPWCPFLFCPHRQGRTRSALLTRNTPRACLASPLPRGSRVGGTNQRTGRELLTGRHRHCFSLSLPPTTTARR